MIGIHRLPRHKSLRVLTGRPPRLIVAEALITKATAWCISRPEIARLLVCPYGEVGPRLRALGFERVDDPLVRLRFGALELRADVCEEAELHAYDCTTHGPARRAAAAAAKAMAKEEL